MRSTSILIVLLLLVFSACRTDEKQDQKEQEERLSFLKERIIKKEGDNCDTEEFNCSIFSMEYYQAEGPAEIAGRINETIQRHLILIFASEERPSVIPLEQMAERFLAEYREVAESFSEEPPWEAYVNQNIYTRSDSIISIGTTAEIFSGGAHGYKTLSFLNFDPQTGAVLRNEELFTPGFQDYFEKIFREEQGIPLNDNINSTGFWFENERFHLPENIGFSDDHVVLVYNSYEIAPYAAGDIYMEIPKEEVQEFLKFE